MVPFLSEFRAHHYNTSWWNANTPKDSRTWSPFTNVTNNHLRLIKHHIRNVSIMSTRMSVPLLRNGQAHEINGWVFQAQQISKMSSNIPIGLIFHLLSPSIRKVKVGKRARETFLYLIYLMFIWQKIPSWFPIIIHFIMYNFVLCCTNSHIYEWTSLLQKIPKLGSLLIIWLFPLIE